MKEWWNVTDEDIDAMLKATDWCPADLGYFRGGGYSSHFKTQAVMPMTGWVCVHTVVELFSSFETFIPWIALILLAYIGGKMLMEGIKGEETEEAAALSAGALFVQGVATSIDALSVGFTISEYGWVMALVASLIIATVTFFICMAGLHIGKKFGTKLAGKASVLGGIILIGIGLEIFLTGIFG